MPSVQVTNKDWNSEVVKDNVLRVEQQNQEKVHVVDKTEHPVKMPCNPSSASQSPPPTGGELRTIHRGNIKQSNGSTLEEAKSKIAKEVHPSVDRHLQPGDPKTSSVKMEDFKVSVDTKPHQATKTHRQKKSEPEIFELLYMVFKGNHCIEIQRSVSSSSEKETNVLTHTISAPGVLSVCKESSLEEQVFDDEQTEEKNTGDQSKKDTQNGKQVDVETKPREQKRENNIGNKDGRKDDTQDRDVEKQDVGKDDSCQEHSEKSSSEGKPQADKVEPAAEDISPDAGDRKKKEEEAKKTVGDIESLTQSLQTNLKLDDGEKAKESKSKGGDVSQLAAGTGRSVLRAKGINNMSNTNYGLKEYHQSQPTHFAPAQSWQTQTQPHFQPNALPPFNKAFSRSVVCPPGQGNFTPIYMNHPGTVRRVQGPAIAQSKQGQLAQNALSPQYQNQAYPLNDLSRGGLSYQTHQQEIPAESTGQPVEVSWPCPLTPESITDMIDSMTSDEESVKSPMENEEPMQSGDLMDFLPSPQSSWQTTSSVASAFSPQHSPYAEQTASLSPQHSPYQDPQGSPLQRVPDTSTWAPVSPGESLPPESPTYNIHSTMGMTASIMTVQDRSPLPHRPPNKQEEEEKIQAIERMLMIPPDPSQSLPQFVHGLPQSGRHFQPNYPVDPYAHMPSVSPPAAVIPSSFVTQQHTPSRVYPPGVTPYIEELEAFKALVAKRSMKALLAMDEDKDTILHVAICKEKVALTVAVIDRLWTEKKSLDMLNNLHQTPLYLSVVCKLDILTEILIMSGASLEIGNLDGNTPLHAAAMTGNTEAIKTITRCMNYNRCSFLEISALFDGTNFEGKTALMVAIEAHRDSVNCAETVKQLLMSNANPMFSDCQSGKTALHYAVELQKVDLIQLLLEECQDASKLVNAKMYNGNTALHLIVGRSIPEVNILYIVGLLMSRGANVSLSNDANEKPCDLVRREHCQVKHHLHGREHHKR